MSSIHVSILYLVLYLYYFNEKNELSELSLQNAQSLIKFAGKYVFLTFVFTFALDRRHI